MQMHCLRVSWARVCMPDNSGTHLKVTATVVWAVQEAALKGPAGPIEAYSCDLHVLDAIQDSKQVACMTLEDWHQAQEVDPVLSLVITRLRDGMLGKGQSNTMDPPKSVSTGGSIIIYCSKRVSCTGRPGPGSQERPSFSWSCQLHRGRLLWEDAMMRLVIWAWSTCLISWQVLLALHGCPGKGACWEVSPMSCFQSQAAKSSPQKHHGHTSSRAGPPWLSVPGTWEGPGWECSGGHRPFHQVCPGICNQDPNHPNDC